MRWGLYVTNGIIFRSPFRLNKSIGKGVGGEWGKLEDWRWEEDLRRKSGWEKVGREGRLVWEEGAMHAGKDLIY